MYFSLILLTASLFKFTIAKAVLDGITWKKIDMASCDVQEDSVKSLMRRTIGDIANRFIVKVDKTMDFRSFEIRSLNDNIMIRGYDGVSISKGFHHYLKYYLQRDISWLDTTVKNVPEKLPDVNVSSVSNSRFIYYQNVCTWSYSYVWWTWSNWRQHIDWMALMGISLTIAPIQEHIWYGIYKHLGLSNSEITNHFAGPAFQAWQRMGNIHGWGGPASDTYRRSQFFLQREIIRAERNLGMTVAIPGFSGHVPIALSRIYPNETFTFVERWNNFPDKYCCSLFVDSDDFFLKIGSTFLKATINAYGTDHIYFSDPFNEVKPKMKNGNYLAKTALNIYQSMTLVDSSAIWLLQGWMFIKKGFWSNEMIKAFVTSIPLGKMIILDLQSEQFPQYERTQSYFGQPFIWCMLHNFGGTLGMHGSANIVNTEIRKAKNMKGSTMIGVGITPEGIDQNYVMYSLALERAWTSYNYDLNNWFALFSNVRYGIKNPKLQLAWYILQSSVYSYQGLLKIRGKYAITQRPSISFRPWVWYNKSSILLAWENMLDANFTLNTLLYNSSFLYEYDLVDITRQFLQVMGDEIYLKLMSAYYEKNITKFKNLSTIMLEIFDDLEFILQTNENFLLGKWIASAKRLGKSPLEKRLFEINARNQITTWGPNARIPDYATKQWSGIVRDFYLPRWKLFIVDLTQSLIKNTQFNASKFKDKVAKLIENPFTVKQTYYPINPSGDTTKHSQILYRKWSKILHDNIITNFV